jgi:hypothetical protein
MRIRLKGINCKRKRLADGSFKTYYWAWKGGPPLRGEPGTPEFVHSYNEAVARKVTPPNGKLLSVLHAYQASGEFNGLAPRTRFDYLKQIKVVERDFGDFPLAGLTDRRTRGIFMAWRDKLAAKSRRQADYAWQMLARILSWAIRTIPFLQHDPDRHEDLWSDSEDHAADSARYACMSRPWVPMKEAPKPENISGYRPYRTDVQPGDWRTY